MGGVVSRRPSSAPTGRGGKGKESPAAWNPKSPFTYLEEVQLSDELGMPRRTLRVIKLLHHNEAVGSYKFVAEDCKTKEQSLLRCSHVWTDVDAQDSMADYRVLTTISHPNIISYKDLFVKSKTLKGGQELLYVVKVTEYVESGSLEDLLNDPNVVKDEAFWSLAKVWMHQILLALLYLHERRIIHRDIKPSNSDSSSAHLTHQSFSCRIGAVLK